MERDVGHKGCRRYGCEINRKTPQVRMKDLMRGQTEDESGPEPDRDDGELHRSRHADQVSPSCVISLESPAVTPMNAEMAKLVNGS
jgi:hypothetical protein